MNWLNHPLLKKSGIIEAVYGEKTTSMTAIFANKEKDRGVFSTAELLRIDEIRQQLIKDLLDPDTETAAILEAHPAPEGHRATNGYRFIRSTSPDHLRQIIANHGGKLIDARSEGYDYIWRK